MEVGTQVSKLDHNNTQPLNLRLWCACFPSQALSFLPAHLHSTPAWPSCRPSSVPNASSALIFEPGSSLCPEWYFLSSFLYLPSLLSVTLFPCFPTYLLFSFISPVWFLSLLIEPNILFAVSSPFDFLLFSAQTTQGLAQWGAGGSLLVIVLIK